MTTLQFESQLKSQWSFMSSQQKEQVLSYMTNLPKEIHSKRRYKKKAMKQIRAALSTHL